MEESTDEEHIPTKRCPVFHVGDSVQVRCWLDSPNYSREGSVISINGKWITVRHDSGSSDPNLRGHLALPPRFDYLSDDLEHTNPLLRFVYEF